MVKCVRVGVPHTAREWHVRTVHTHSGVARLIELWAWREGAKCHHKHE